MAFILRQLAPSIESPCGGYRPRYGLRTPRIYRNHPEARRIGEDYIRARPVLSFNFSEIEDRHTILPGVVREPAPAAPLQSQSPARTGSCHGNGRRGAPPCHRAARIRMPTASGVGNGFFLQAVTTSTARPASGVGITSTNR